MKHLYSLVAFLGIGTMVFAQAPINPTLKNNLFYPSNDFVKNVSGERAVGVYLIDFEGVEDLLFSGTQAYVDLSLNTSDTTNGNFHSVWTVVDSLQVTPEDYSSFNYFAPNTVLNLTVDSFFIIFGHQNNSGLMDKIRFRLTNAINITSGANTYKDWNTVYWSDSIMTDTSITGPFNGSGYPITVMGFPVGVSVPAPYNFGMEVTYEAPQVDSLALRFSWATDGGNCTGGPFTSVPSLVDPALYPTAYYSITTGGGTPGNPNYTFNLPRVNDGAYWWWIDCDGSSTDTPNENPYHYWSMWFKVTISDNVGIDEQDAKGIHVYNYPNPANETTNINFDLKKSANVNLYVTDLSGKRVVATNIGNFNAGKNVYTLNTSSFSAGVYLYTLDVDGVHITRRMVINK